MLAEPAAIFSTWFALARKYRVSGKRSHDLRLVATMKELETRKLSRSTSTTSKASPR
jgi:hypothetical protein